MAKKIWFFKDVECLLYLYNKSIPAKVLSQLFMVSANAIHKTIQRYKNDNLEEFSYKFNNIYKPLDSITQWMRDNIHLLKILKKNYHQWSSRVLAVNKIIVSHGFQPLDYYELQNIFFILQV
jgi:hypothetical protein